MPPNVALLAGINNEGTEKEKKQPETEFVPQIVWTNVAFCTAFHLAGIYGIYLAITGAAMWKTLFFAYFVFLLGNLGVTAGIHRLWSHRSYKAKWPLRALLTLFAGIASQNDILEWARDHRVHHKFVDTNADPHNINRGFFFAHMGWLLCKKHPDVIEKGKGLNFDDLWADPFLRFHRKYFYEMMAVFSFYFPTMIPVWYWNEPFWTSLFVAGFARYILSLHFTFLINSAAHYWGNQPYDKYMEARENAWVSLFTVGEGWHNFHHAFSWDYAASELGYTLNLTKLFIDFMAFVGLAYDLRVAHPQVVDLRKRNRGDGSR